MSETISERSGPADDVEEGILLTRRPPRSHTEPSLDNGGNLDGGADNGGFDDIPLETLHPREQPPGSSADGTPNPSVPRDGRIVD